jgi:hypothetical protein
MVSVLCIPNKYNYLSYRVAARQNGPFCLALDCTFTWYDESEP